MARVKGYQGLLYYGPAGTTAPTLIECRTTVNYDITPKIGETTCAGNGTDIPIESGEAVSIKAMISFTMIIRDDVPATTTLAAAAATGDPIALRFEVYSGSKGFDCDCIISIKEGAPIDGNSTMDVNVEAISESQRTALLNA